MFRRLHPRFKTPWLVARSSSPGIIPILVLLPGNVDFLGDMYAFGAMLSFTIAHAVDRSRCVRRRDEETRLPRRGRTSDLAASTGRSSRSSAGSAPASRGSSSSIQNPTTRYAGLGWLAVGFVVYAVYRRRVVHEPLRETVRAPAIVLGPALALEYRTILVPVVRTAESEEALVVAARLAAERGAT